MNREIEDIYNKIEKINKEMIIFLKEIDKIFSEYAKRKIREIEEIVNVNNKSK